MKTSRILAMAVLGAVNLAAAQSYPEGFPHCGSTCIDNMLGQAQQLGCSSNEDTACLCSNQEWVWGVRDCSNQACGDGNAGTVQDYASSYCADASVLITYNGATGTAAASTEAASATGTLQASSSAASTTSEVASLSTVTWEGTTFTSTVASSTGGSQATATTTDGGDSANAGARLSAPAGLVAAAGAAVLFL